MATDGVAGSQIYKGLTDLLVLAVLRSGSSYGYEIHKAIGAAGADQLSEASIYGTLKRLSDQGMVESELVASPAGPARRYYRVTKHGLDHLEAGLTVWNSLTIAVDRLAGRPS